MPGRPGAQGAGQHREPVPDRGRIVVDDVVDGGPGVLEGQDGGRGAVAEVQPGEDPAAVADHRELALAHRLDERVVGRAVEPAVAQRDAAEAGHGPLQVADRGVGPAGVRRRVLVDRVGLGLDQPALARVQVGREALGHEPAHAGVGGRGQQRVGALGPQPVGDGEGLVQVAAEADAGQRGGLVHDRLRPGGEHGRAHGGRVEQVEPDRFSAERFQHPGAGRGVMGAGHLVPGVDELADQVAPERAAGARHEDSHRVFLSLGGVPSAGMTRRRPPV